MNLAGSLCDSIFMIYKGRKVLDGTLDSIQSKYGEDTIRLRLNGSVDPLKGLEGVTHVRDRGRYQEVRYAGDPQELLRALVAKTEVRLFEVTRPSLHDIFIRIARPETGEAADHE